MAPRQWVRHLPAEAAPSQATRVKSALALSPVVFTRAATRPAGTRSVLEIKGKHDPHVGAGLHHLVVLGEISGDEWVIAEPVGLLARHQQVRTPRRYRRVDQLDDPRQVRFFCLTLPPVDEREVAQARISLGSHTPDHVENGGRRRIAALPREYLPRHDVFSE